MHLNVWNKSTGIDKLTGGSLCFIIPRPPCKGMHLTVRNTCRAKAPDRSPETRILLLYPRAPLLEVEKRENSGADNSRNACATAAAETAAIYMQWFLCSLSSNTPAFFSLWAGVTILPSHHVIFNSLASEESWSTELYVPLIIHSLI